MEDADLDRFGSAEDIAGQPAAAAVAELFRRHYPQLVRLAYLLLRDAAQAEELVQDAFVDLHARWARLQDRSAAGGYLRASVVNRARSALRHRRVVAAHDARQVLGDVASAESGALAALHAEQILASLHRLPARQREVLVLRYYAQLSEAEIAATLGISRGAVKSHSSRGLHALRPVLESAEGASR